MKNNKGITLVALVVTVIILIVLVGVTTASLTDEDRSITRAAGNLTNNINTAFEQNDGKISGLQNDLSNQLINFQLEETDYKDPTGANEPTYISGLKAITFNEDGTTKAVTKKSEWYNYNKKEWANAESSDGSLWVWIPRFAYKIVYTNPLNKSQGGTIDIVFLNGTSSKYYNNGVLTDAEANGYNVHPSFKANSGTNYSNGEWNNELTGYWISKFEAGYQQGDAINTTSNNKSNTVYSNINYTSGVSYISSNENAGTAGYNVSRNYINGTYGSNLSGILNDLDAYGIQAERKISYPVFKGANYSMNYISVGDAYRLSKALTEEGNIYGFNSKTTQSHMMKNSEWGAVSYLSYSKYGTNGGKIYINNINLNSTVSTIYGVTGCTGLTYNAEQASTLTQVNLWYTTNGQKGSSNHNITGVYDLAGALWERTSAFISNADNSINRFGYAISRDSINSSGESIGTKEVTKYNFKTLTGDHTDEEARNENYVQNSDKKGDATVEISSSGNGITGWDYATSVFPSEELPFFIRGGSYEFTGNAGVFSYSRTSGEPRYDSGFRVVVCN